jgi:hypothetical protein
LTFGDAAIAVLRDTCVDQLCIVKHGKALVATDAAVFN